MTIVDPSLSLASELGSPSVKELELKNAQEEMAEVKKTFLDKTKLLTKLLQRMRISEGRLKQVSNH